MKLQVYQSSNICFMSSLLYNVPFSSISFWHHQNVIGIMDSSVVHAGHKKCMWFAIILSPTVFISVEWTFDDILQSSRKEKKNTYNFIYFLSNLRRPVPLSTQTIQAKEKETSRLNPSSASYLGALKLEPEDCDCGELWEGLTGSVDVPDGWESVALAPWTVASVDVPVSMAAVCSAALFLGFCIAKQQTTTMSHKLNDKLTDAD